MAANAAKDSPRTSAIVPKSRPAKIALKVCERNMCQTHHAGPFSCCPICFGNISAGVEGSRQFRGDGYLIFTPDSKPIALPWTVNFVFRTRQSDTFLIKIDMGANNFASVQLADGRLKVRWESGEFNLTDSEPLSDGKWHATELKWMHGELWLSTDYGHHEKTVPVDSKLNGLEVTKVSVGGVNDNDADDVIGLVGCIKDVRLGNQRHQWLRTAVEHRVGEGCSGSDSCSRNDVCPLHGVCTDTWNSHTCTCEPGTFT